MLFKHFSGAKHPTPAFQALALLIPTAVLHKGFRYCYPCILQTGDLRLREVTYMVSSGAWVAAFRARALKPPPPLGRAPSTSPGAHLPPTPSTLRVSQSLKLHAVHPMLSFTTSTTDLKPVGVLTSSCLDCVSNCIFPRSYEGGAGKLET